MKKLLSIILLAAVFGLSGCVATMNDLENYKKEQSAQGEETRMRLAAIEAGAGVSPADIEKLLEGSEVTKIRAFTGLEGDTTGTLDKIDKADILDGDIGLVFTPAGGIYFYTYEDSDTQAEASPYVIYANDRAAGPGAWLLQTGFYMGRSALPANVFRDSGAADYDDNARIYANCDDGDCTTATEDVDMYFQAQIGGTANTTWLHFDCDASGNCDIDFVPAGTGGLDFADKNVANVGTIGADEVNADGSVLKLGQIDEETQVFADAIPDVDDTYSCFSGLSGVQAGEDIAQFDVVYINGTDGQWHAADATTAGAEWPALGFAVECPGGGGWPCQDGETMQVCLSGVIRNDGWTFSDHNKVQYVDETTAGALIETPPATAGDLVQPVGIAIRSETAGDAEDVLLFPVPAWGLDDGA